MSHRPIEAPVQRLTHTVSPLAAAYSLSAARPAHEEHLLAALVTHTSRMVQHLQRRLCRVISEAAETSQLRPLSLRHASPLFGNSMSGVCYLSRSGLRVGVPLGVPARTLLTTLSHRHVVTVLTLAQHGLVGRVCWPVRLSPQPTDFRHRRALLVVSSCYARTL